jgi:hypothetical protein
MKVLKRILMFVLLLMALAFLGLLGVDNAVSMKYELYDNSCLSAVTGFDLCFREKLYVGGFWSVFILIVIYLSYLLYLNFKGDKKNNFLKTCHE